MYQDADGLYELLTFSLALSLFLALFFVPFVIY